ncbi:tripartite tricarboxylate transporter TctB family protein [Tardiphaga sp. 866_E4_N2_1]|jgi:hypothetical protein|uniref:tripartite tricarboxylate transporter TctB family protein n=1 Tax=unclassified Tardiphaga TaxID=2631404 RepID=UPI000B6CC1A0|nr:tripartite tricarboxylate transporter TctB family protein [Tardiphaga sp. OK246]SNT53253.1 Tripartite tricarboxylate transporter TctB family protein [Tardiphaga sp. OK246]
MVDATAIDVDAPASTKGSQLTSLILTAAGLFYLYQSLQLSMGDPLGTGVGAMPALVAVCWVAFGVFVTVRNRPAADVGPWPRGRLALRVGYSLLLCIAFIVALPVFGVFLTTAVFLLLMARLVDATWKNACIVAVTMPIAFWVVFSLGLKVSLPYGVLLTTIFRN